MKAAPRGGMITSLVDVNGRIRSTDGEAKFVPGSSAKAGIPASARQDAPAAPFNNSRRDILVSMIAFTPNSRQSSASTTKCHEENLAFRQDFSKTYVL